MALRLFRESCKATYYLSFRTAVVLLLAAYVEFAVKDTTAVYEPAVKVSAIGAVNTPEPFVVAVVDATVVEPRFKVIETTLLLTATEPDLTFPDTVTVGFFET
jgi:hypothetical protein